MKTKGQLLLEAILEESDLGRILVINDWENISLGIRSNWEMVAGRYETKLEKEQEAAEFASMGESFGVKALSE